HIVLPAQLARGGNLGDALGCHQRPPITTPSDTILRSPIRCSPTTSTKSNLPCGIEISVASPALPGLRLPSSGRRSAIAALTVEAATTSGSDIPMHRNFDMVVT